MVLFSADFLMWIGWIVWKWLNFSIDCIDSVCFKSCLENQLNFKKTSTQPCQTKLKFFVLKQWGIIGILTSIKIWLLWVGIYWKTYLLNYTHNKCKDIYIALISKTLNRSFYSYSFVLVKHYAWLFVCIVL